MTWWRSKWRSTWRDTWPWRHEGQTLLLIHNALRHLLENIIWFIYWVSVGAIFSLFKILVLSTSRFKGARGSTPHLSLLKLVKKRWPPGRVATPYPNPPLRPSGNFLDVLVTQQMTFSPIYHMYPKHAPLPPTPHLRNRMDQDWRSSGFNSDGWLPCRHLCHKLYGFLVLGLNSDEWLSCWHLCHKPYSFLVRI